jgi:hypothetical protein
VSITEYGQLNIRASHCQVPLLDIGLRGKTMSDFSRHRIQGEVVLWQLTNCPLKREEEG